MTITLSSEQEKAVRAAIQSGHVDSIGEWIDRAVAVLPKTAARPSAQAQGLGLFASPGDASLLDDVVAMAYEERRRPSKREP